MLNNQQKINLLKAARNAIARELGLDFNDADLRDSVFDGKFGIFVSLHKAGELRGCIGYIQGYKTLRESVSDMAFSAAFNDPRFPRVQSVEFADLEIEISILSPIESVSDISQIECGRDGLIIRNGNRSGLLLPQVATQYGWNTEEFLANTCRKAGLPSDAWKDSSSIIEKFSASVFSEREFHVGR